MDELHKFLFDCEVDGREKFHDAMVDVRATVKCFFKLKEIKTGSKPTPAQYGYLESIFQEDPGGWVHEGGETIYYNHLTVWEVLNQSK